MQISAAVAPCALFFSEATWASILLYSATSDNLSVPILESLSQEKR